MSVEINNITQNNAKIYPVKINSAQRVYNTKNIKTQKTQDNMPLARKLGIAFLSAFSILYVTVMGIRRHNYNKTSIKSITEELSKVFRRDLSEKETKEILRRYKELFKIDDAETFTRKAFKQIKKDYGYEKAEIPLTIKCQNGWKLLAKFLINPFNKIQFGVSYSGNPEMEILVLSNKKGKLSNRSKISVMESLYHELKHIEQSHLCYLKDKERFFHSIIKSVGKYQYISLFKQREMLNELNENYTRAFKNVPQKDISKYSNLIAKYIENTENYKNCTEVKLKEYKKQILEQEAYNAGKVGTQFKWLGAGSLFYVPKGILQKILLASSAGCFAKDGYDTFVSS